MTEFKTVDEAYRVAVGEEGINVNLKEVFGFVMLAILVLMPFWFEHVLIWYYGL